MTEAIAFSSDCFVMMSRGRMFLAAPRRPACRPRTRLRPFFGSIGRHGRAVHERHAEDLDGHRHRVRGVLAAAGAGAGAGKALDVVQLLVVILPACVGADRLEDVETVRSLPS